MIVDCAWFFLVFSCLKHFLASMFLLIILQSAREQQDNMSTNDSPYETYNLRSGCLISYDSLQQVKTLKTWLLNNLTTEKYFKDIYIYI